MKLFRKIAIACLTLLTTAGMATACSLTKVGTASIKPLESESISDTAPEDSTTPEEEEEAQYIYRVKVQNASGYGFKNITVRLKDGGEVVAEKTTSSLGYADFGRSEILALGNQFDYDLTAPQL